MVLSIHVHYKPESVNIKALTVWSLILVISFTRSLTKDSRYYLHCYHAIPKHGLFMWIQCWGRPCRSRCSCPRQRRGMCSDVRRSSHHALPVQQHPLSWYEPYWQCQYGSSSSCWLIQHHATSCNNLLPPTTPFYLLQNRAGTNRTTNTSCWLYEEPPVPTDDDDDDDEPSSGDFNANISDDLHS